MKSLFEEFADYPTEFSRSYLILVGALMIIASTIMAYKSIIMGTEKAYWLTYIAMIVTLVTGIYCIRSAFSKGASLVNSFADGLSKHEAAILLIVVAWPLHLILKKTWRRIPRE